MTVRYFALVLGIVYTLVGILGFLPFALTPAPADAPDVTVDSLYGLLIGLFPVNVLHTIVHLVIGLWGIFAYRGFDASRTFAKTVGIIFGVLALMGLFPGLNTTFGLIPLFGHDVWLHALTSLAGLYFGFMAPREARAVTD